MKIRAIITLLLTLSIFSNTTGKTKNLTVSKVKIAALGDLVMHIPVKAAAKSRNKVHAGKSINNRGFDFLFKPCAEIFKKHDAVIANMEFPVVHPYKSRAFVFNCEPEVIPAMKKAGINMVTFANNHSFDKGPGGVVETIKNLKRYGMKFIGAGVNEKQARRGIIINKNGLKVGMIAYSNIFNINRNSSKPGRPRVNDLRKTKLVIRDIARIKKKVDFVILVVHWGVEYKIRPRKYEKRFAKLYLEAGVDMIIGHHPHVLQSVETYKTKDGRKCLIFYSLGNFISNQAYYYRHYKRVKKGRERDSVILSLNIVKKPRYGLIKKGEKRYTTFLEKAVLIPVWTVNRRNYKNKRAPIFIRTYPIHDLLKKINYRLKNKKGNRKYLILQRKMLKKRLKEIKRVLFYKGKPERVQFYSPGDEA